MELCSSMGDKNYKEQMKHVSDGAIEKKHREARSAVCFASINLLVIAE